MRYLRSSFINYLTNIHTCDITTLTNRSGTGIKINNGPAHSYMNMTKYITYEEILLHCNKLWLTSIPGDSDLVIED